MMTFSDRLRGLQKEFFTYTESPERWALLNAKWTILTDDITKMFHLKRLTPEEALLATSVAHNLSSTSRNILALEQEANVLLDQVTEGLSKLFVHRYDDVSHSSRLIQVLSSPHSILVKRKSDFSATSRIVKQQRPSPPLQDTTLPPPEPQVALRHWFLDNLSAPFVSPRDRKRMSEEIGLSAKKIDTHLTNWRRRCGWTHMRETYANKSRDGMKQILDRMIAVEEGREIKGAGWAMNGKDLLDLGIWDSLPDEEKREFRGTRRRFVDVGGRLKLGFSVEKEEELFECVRRMRAYFEKQESDAVGDWMKDVVGSAEVVVSPPSQSNPMFPHLPSDPIPLLAPLHSTSPSRPRPSQYQAIRSKKPLQPDATQPVRSHRSSSCLSGVSEPSVCDLLMAARSASGSSGASTDSSESEISMLIPAKRSSSRQVSGSSYLSTSPPSDTNFFASSSSAFSLSPSSPSTGPPPGYSDYSLSFSLPATSIPDVNVAHPTPQSQLLSCSPTSKTLKWSYSTPESYTFGREHVDSKTFHPHLPLYSRGVASWDEIPAQVALPDGDDADELHVSGGMQKKKRDSGEESSATEAAGPAELSA